MFLGNGKTRGGGARMNFPLSNKAKFCIRPLRITASDTVVRVADPGPDLVFEILSDPVYNF